MLCHIQLRGGYVVDGRKTVWVTVLHFKYAFHEPEPCPCKFNSLTWWCQYHPFLPDAGMGYVGNRLETMRHEGCSSLSVSYSVSLESDKTIHYIINAICKTDKVQNAQSFAKQDFLWTPKSIRRRTREFIIYLLICLFLRSTQDHS